MSARKNATAIWVTRLGVYPYQQVQAQGEIIRLACFPGGTHGFSFCLSRADARLFARRINQCLDGTKK